MISRGADSGEKGRIRAIGNNHGMVNQKEENFKGMSTKVKMVAKKSKREQINTNV